MRREDVSLFRFLRSLFTGWLGAMSGGLSVPLAIAALFVEGPIYRLLFGGLSVVAFVTASYNLWRAERERLASSDEEIEHQRWTSDARSKLLAKGGPDSIPLAPGERLHAVWAAQRGLLDFPEQELGQTVILPAAERWGPEKVQEAAIEGRKFQALRKTILSECAARPGAFLIWRHGDFPDWETALLVARSLHSEGLIEAKIGADRVELNARITTDGIGRVRNGFF